ncbi:MAG: hypothetical protein FWC79_03270 [Oscillospiraceae bacterium]|nr:hypothetical protein [Oscillospiraceae bacterium]
MSGARVIRPIHLAINPYVTEIEWEDEMVHVDNPVLNVVPEMMDLYDIGIRWDDSKIINFRNPLFVWGRNPATTYDIAMDWDGEETNSGIPPYNTMSEVINSYNPYDIGIKWEDEIVYLDSPTFNEADETMDLQDIEIRWDDSKIINFRSPLLDLVDDPTTTYDVGIDWDEEETNSGIPPYNTMSEVINSYNPYDIGIKWEDEIVYLDSPVLNEVAEDINQQDNDIEIKLSDNDAEAIEMGKIELKETEIKDSEVKMCQSCQACKNNLPAKITFWTKVRRVLFYEVKIQLVPREKKIKRGRRAASRTLWEKLGFGKSRQESCM